MIFYLGDNKNIALATKGNAWKLQLTSFCAEEYSLKCNSDSIYSKIVD